MSQVTKGRWLHKKTGNVYVVEGVVINATNAQRSEAMVLYFRAEDPPARYVRNVPEFLTRFKVLK